MINPDIQTRIQQLPAKQQRHFHDLLKDGEDNPRKAASSLRQALFDGEVDQDYQLTSQLAVAALTDPHDEGKFPTETEARGGYQNEIRRLREIDPDDPTAARLEGILNKLSSREATDRTRAETVKKQAEKATSKLMKTGLMLLRKPTPNTSSNVLPN
jgi:hypothetical protein